MSWEMVGDIASKYLLQGLNNYYNNLDTKNIITKALEFQKLLNPTVDNFNEWTKSNSNLNDYAQNKMTVDDNFRNNYSQYIPDWETKNSILQNQQNILKNKQLYANAGTDEEKDGFNQEAEKSRSILKSLGYKGNLGSDVTLEDATKTTNNYNSYLAKLVQDNLYRKWREQKLKDMGYPIDLGSYYVSPK